ncbi:MAG: response regulator transcription factor [bacterium]
MRALVIEDEPALREQVVSALGEAGFTVEQAGDGQEGSWMAEEFPLDLAIVDLGLPLKTGMEVIQGLRAAGLKYPVLILTARNRWQDKVEGLEAGADDYLAKPFHVEELIARARALIRRSGGWSQSELRSGPVVLDTRSQTVQLDGEEVALTAYEYRLLEYLLVHAGEVLSKTVLTEHIYTDDDVRDSNVIEVFVRRLRRKLDPSGSLNPIVTQRGKGYRWQLPRDAS